MSTSSRSSSGSPVSGPSPASLGAPAGAPTPAPIPGPAAHAPRRRFVGWPLWISVAGLLGLAALFSETRPDLNGSDFDYPVTAEDVAGLDHLPFRIAGLLGYLTAIVMLVAAAVWTRRVVRRHPDSLGAPLVASAVVASAGLTALTFGWRGALGNYLPGAVEENTYDADGLYGYYVMNDFSPYIAMVPLLAAAFGLAWMAFAERLISRPLGACAGVLGTALLAATAITGVPGLPAMVLAGLVVAGPWLAFGRSVAVTG